MCRVGRKTLTQSIVKQKPSMWVCVHVLEKPSAIHVCLCVLYSAEQLKQVSRALREFARLYR